MRTANVASVTSALRNGTVGNLFRVIAHMRARLVLNTSCTRHHRTGRTLRPRPRSSGRPSTARTHIARWHCTAHLGSASLGRCRRPSSIRGRRRCCRRHRRSHCRRTARTHHHSQPSTRDSRAAGHMRCSRRHQSTSPTSTSHPYRTQTQPHATVPCRRLQPGPAGRWTAWPTCTV